MEVEGVSFSSRIIPHGSTKQFILGGAGVRGLEIDGKFVVLTAIGIYMEEDIIPHLALKWKYETAEELGKSEDFFMDIVTCPYEKLARVSLFLPLSGIEYSEKVSEECKAAWEAAEIYHGEAEAQALQKFKAIFKDQKFSPGSSIQFTISSIGLVIAAFSKDSSIPDKAGAVIENSVLARGILFSIIGKNGASPAAKASIAQRMSKLYFPEEDRLVTLLSEMEVEGIWFCPTVKPLGSTKELLLGGAGFRGLEVEGKFKKYTAIGIYIERSIISHLALKWKGKTAEELNNSLDFCMEIVTCEYEKFFRLYLISLLSGSEFAKKVCENCKAYLEGAEKYGEAEGEALQEFKAAFEDKNLPPGSTIWLTCSPAGLVIAFSEGDSIPEKAAAVIENKAIGEAYLATVIGENGVSPAARASLAQRLSQLF